MNKEQAVKWIDSNIVGALYGGEGALLYDLAKNCKGNGVIVEIGSLLGKSTAFLAFGSKAGQNVKVITIDPFDGGNTKAHSQFVKNLIKKGNYYPKFNENMRKTGILDIVTSIPKRSREAVDYIKEPVELLFVDGAHSYPIVKSDIEYYLPKVVRGGMVAFHDRNRDGVKEAIEELILSPKRLGDVKTFKSILYGWKR